MRTGTFWQPFCYLSTSLQVHSVHCIKSTLLKAVLPAQKRELTWSPERAVSQSKCKTNTSCWCLRKRHLLRSRREGAWHYLVQGNLKIDSFVFPPYSKIWRLHPTAKSSYLWPQQWMIQWASWEWSEYKCRSLDSTDKVPQQGNSKKAKMTSFGSRNA